MFVFPFGYYTDCIWIERRKGDRWNQNCKTILSSVSLYSFAIFSLTENSLL